MRSCSRQRLLLTAAGLAVVGLAWGCAGAPGAPAAKPQGHFLMFERGDRALCCGLALLQDGGVVVVGRADMLHPRMPWAWATKILPGGGLAWKREWPVENESTGFLAATEIAGGAVIAVGDRQRFGLIASIDTAGATSWTKLLRLDDMTRLHAVLDDAGDGFVVAGAATAFTSKPWSVFVARLTPSGDIAKHTSLGEGDEVTRLRRAAKDGYVLVSASWDVILLDQSLRILWRHDVRGALDAAGLSDGSVVVLAYPEYASTEPRVQRFGADGVTIWERRVSGSAVCNPSGIWVHSGDRIMVASDPCDDSELMAITSLSATGEKRSVHQVRLRAAVGAADVRPDVLGGVVAAGMFHDDQPDGKMGWLFRSGAIPGLDRPVSGNRQRR